MAPESKHIDEETVVIYRCLHYNWKKVAELLGVHMNTLGRWRHRVGFVDPLESVPNDDLDRVIAQFSQKNRGEMTCIGHLRSLGIYAPRSQIRESINRVDYAGRQQRKQKTIKRRQYEVHGPHHLWHIDGHHKLIQYGMVTHGCIDGYSRAVIYLRCCNNNLSKTTYKLMKHGVKDFMIPSRIRGDKGGENVLIADYIIQQRGVGRGSFIAGQSKHNTRIERLWRDVMCSCISFYKDLFMEMEKDELDPGNELHLYVLQYMFMTRINQDLDQFRESWNHHPIRTAHNRSPYQILEENKELQPVEIDEVEIDEVENIEVEVEEDVPYVHVEPINCPFNNEKEDYFKQHCKSLYLEDDKNTLYNRFMCALAFANDINII